MSRQPSDTPDGRSAGEGFVQRWARRKAEATKTDDAPPGTMAGEAPSAAPAKVLTDADMPPIESLDEQSDYSLFLSPGVSEELRRLALRKLFHLPEFNQRFELDGEYYDCTKLEPLGSIVTYDMREEMKRAAEKLVQTERDRQQRRPAEAAPASGPAPLAAPPADPPGAAAFASGAAAANSRKATARGRARSRRKA